MFLNNKFLLLTFFMFIFLAVPVIGANKKVKQNLDNESKFLPEFDDLDRDCLDENPKRIRSIFTSFQSACSTMRKKFYKVGLTYVHISRWNIIDDSFADLKFYKNTNPEALKQQLNVLFENECAIDIGGPAKEWFSLFSAEVFNPEFKLFRYSDDTSSTVEIDPKSGEKYPKRHLEYFELLGIFTGMGIYHERYLSVFFSIPFLKTMLHRQISLNDVKIIDPEFYQSLLWTLKNDPTKMEWKFTSLESEDKLITKNGDQMMVDNTNKRKYVRLLINWKYIRTVQEQMSAFLKGFRSIISLETIEMFSTDELQIIIAGPKTIDVSFWKKCTSYRKPYTSNSKQIEWFWNEVISFTVEEQAALLSFVTGHDRLAMDGRRNFEFLITCAGSIRKPPTAHTCINRLDLPPYKTKEDLARMLKIVVRFPSTYAQYLLED